MRTIRQLVTLLVVAIVFSLLAPAGMVQGQAVKNPDTLVIQHFGDPVSLDPSYAYDTASSGVITWNVYETLIFFNGNRTDQYLPLLATEVPSLANGGISRDGKTYTFKVRQGVKFHDGSALTAQDVKYSLMRFMLLDPDGGPAWILLASILGFDSQATRDDSGKLLPDIWDRANRAIAVKGNNVEITLKQPYGPFLNIMAIWSMVVSKRFSVANAGWDGNKGTLARFNNPERPDAQELFDKGSGTGPFKIERWDRGTGTVALVRNADYWRGPAKLQRIVIQKVDEFSARRLALQNGDADIIEVTRPDQPAVTGISGVRIVDDLAQLVTNDVIYFVFNINTEANPDIGSGRLDGNGIPPNFFSDVHVRRAFAHLFDRAKFIEEAHRGKGRLANGPIPFGMLGYNPRGKWYEVSRDRAIAEFREAWGGQVWERGFKFTLSFNTGNVRRQIEAQMIKEAVEALNPKFKIDVRSIVWATYLGLMRQKKMPMFIVGWIADYADPDNFSQPFLHSDGLYPGRQGYKNAEADRLVVAAAGETDPKKRADIYFKLQEIAYQEVPAIYTVYNTDFVVMRSWVKGWYHNPMFWETWNHAYRLSKSQ